MKCNKVNSFRDVTYLLYQGYLVIKPFHHLKKKSNMRNLLFILGSTFIQSVVFSQIVSIKVKQTQPYVKYIKTTAADVLANPDWVGYKEPGNCEYVLDLNKKTSTYYENGVFGSTLKFESMSKIGDNVRIKLIDKEKVFGIVFKTEFNYNIKLGTSSYTWYNEFGDYTRTQKNTIATITVGN